MSPFKSRNSVGTAVTFPLCGLLIDRLGWEYAFYVPGALGAVWCLLWWELVFDSPASHPRISREEKEMIEREVGTHLARKQVIRGSPGIRTELTIMGGITD
uniref:Major facilitator superfamily (MFS) profile domain-containing protein n=1 Tax=Timema cristinae TaxID=61476 RepID=A0A7R9DPA7_TIMCR|nr:unnamed protein product [Timema cristinae]